MLLKLEQWCKTSSILLNLCKTKELILNHTGVPAPLLLANQKVEIVNCFKYLGTYTDRKLNFLYVYNILYVKKANQMLYLIRKLKGFGVTFELVPLGRRYRAQGKNIYKHSFIPWAALLFVKLKLRIIFQAYLRCNEYTE